MSNALTIEQILLMLEEAPARIASLAEGLTLKQLQESPRPGDWSTNDVLAHLRSCADIWGGCIATILEQDRPTIRAINPRTWIRGTDYLEQTFFASLPVFAAQRANLMIVLHSLSPEAWQRSATVTGAGKALIRTVHYYAESLALHERPHIKQMKSIAEFMRRSAPIY